MKKLLTLSFALLLISACSNKHILVKNAEKYPADKYITKVAYASKKDQAKQQALKDIKTLYASLPEGDTYTQARRQAVLDSAKIVETWKDKINRKYYAMAAIDREQAKKITEPAYTRIDGKLKNMAEKIEQEPNKWRAVQYAFAMEELFKERQALDEEYALVSHNEIAYQENSLNDFKNSHAKAFDNIKIVYEFEGFEDKIVKSKVIEALNDLGFGVSEKPQESDIILHINIVLDKFPSQTTNGLYWCTSTANVNLKEAPSGNIFATLSESQKVGTFRHEEAQRRSQIAAGQACAPIVREKLVQYINKK
ncbi:MAG: hypothetical protein II972_00550 [Elusimicrobiaceae bacterium]|nr:hypothetical protein [Elusimicrobiaceae bacterium]